MNAFARIFVAFCLTLSVFVSVGAAPAWSQTTEGSASTELDYDAWETAATAAENLISGGVASTAFFENRRSELVRWRAQFLAAQAANAERIATIQAQIDALGPAPAEGEVEPDSIAARRAALQERLDQAQVPGLAANEAFNRANGLIAEIDTILLERQTQELLELEPTPLNPVNWATALSALADLAGNLQLETAETLSDDEVRTGIADNAPAILGMLLIGFVMVLRGRKFVARLGERFLDGDGRRGRTVLGFLVSLGQLVIPVIGLALIVAALALSDLLTEDGETLLAAILALIISVYAALWLAGRLFPDHEQRAAAFETDPSLRAPMRRTILLIGLLTGLGNLAQVVADLDIVPPAARGVLVVPVHIGLGLMYWRLSGLLRRIRAPMLEGESGGFATGVLGLVATALRVLAVVGPLLGVIGYINAAEALMVPVAMTLFLFGVLLALQAVVRDLYALAFRTSQDAAGEALLPVLVNFVLFAAAAPLLAITWGVRPERLWELWVRILEGFTLGDTRITPGIILAVILVFAAGLLITRLLQGALKSTVLPRTKLDVGARNAVSAGVGYVGIALAALIAVTSAGIDLTALGFVVGALSVGIGFGLQNVVSNFVSGIILLIERPISEGDWIEVNGNMGIVKDISVRSTTIETFDKTDVIVPNADFISGTVTNWTRGNTVGRAIVTVGVAYGTDTRRVSDILMEIAEGHPDVAKFPQPGVDFLGFGADSLDFRVRVILRDINQLVAVKTELHHQIAERFTAEGIEIPFAQRDIWLRNPEALSQSQPPVPEPE
ncbi:DUF3772 domain-containing protein [Gymnodinialimonas hymeniacidonis]|uniref:DUF3772 domain-containing protein n=1 Tax=Gymnodinialimonas hymeniacidonis TaxID=3126508 RepID=UPI0034C63372